MEGGIVRYSKERDGAAEIVQNGPVAKKKARAVQKSRHAAKTVDAVFIDADSGREIARSAIPPAQLPASFEASTTLDVAGGKYQVVSADPMTRSAAKKRGSISLRLRRFEARMVSPQDILFTLPTIESSRPAMAPGSMRLGRRVLTLHEDDWRQVEALTEDAAQHASSELAAIVGVHEGRRGGTAFRELHARRLVPEPLEGGSFPLRLLTANTMADTREFEGIAFDGQPGLVQDGFAVGVTDGLIAYGRAPGGEVRELALIRRSSDARPDERWAPFVAFLIARHLVLIDWCRAKSARGEGKALREFLGSVWPVAGTPPGIVFSRQGSPTA